MPAVDCNIPWSMFLVFLVIFLDIQFSNNRIKTSPVLSLAGKSEGKDRQWTDKSPVSIQE